MLARHHAHGIAADVATDRHDQEDEHPSGAIRFSEQEDGERRQERHVGGDEDAAGDVADRIMEPIGHPPEQQRDAGQTEGDGQRLPATDERRDDHGDGADHAGHQRDIDLALGEAAAQLPYAEAGSHDHHPEKSLLAEDQARDDHSTKTEADADGSWQVAPCTAGARPGAFARCSSVATGGRCCRHTLMFSCASILEELGFLDLEDGVDVLDMLLGEGLKLFFSTGALVLTDLALLDEVVDLFLGLAPDVTDGHLGIFGLGVGKLDVLLATLFCQLRQVDPDDGAVAVGVDAQIRVTQRPLDLGHRRLVEGRDQDRAGLRSLERRKLLQWGPRAVVVHGELVEHRGVSPPGTDGCEVLFRDLDGFLHLFLGLVHGFVDHQDSSSAVTSVPILSPRMALAMLPSPSIPNTIIGSLFSEQMANAAASTTRRPCCSALSYEIRSSLWAVGSLRGSAL